MIPSNQGQLFQVKLHRQQTAHAPSHFLPQQRSQNLSGGRRLQPAADPQPPKPSLKRLSKHHPQQAFKDAPQKQSNKAMCGVSATTVSNFRQRPQPPDNPVNPSPCQHENNCHPAHNSGSYGTADLLSQNLVVRGGAQTTPFIHAYIHSFMHSLAARAQPISSAPRVTHQYCGLSSKASPKIDGVIPKAARAGLRPLHACS